VHETHTHTHTHTYLPLIKTVTFAQYSVTIAECASRNGGKIRNLNSSQYNYESNQQDATM